MEEFRVKRRECQEENVKENVSGRIFSERMSVEEFIVKRECQWKNLGLKEESVGFKEVSGRDWHSLLLTLDFVSTGTLFS